MNIEQDKKPKNWKIILLIAGIAIVICALIATSIIYYELSKIKKYTPEATIAPQNETFEKDDQVTPNTNSPYTDPETVTWPANVKPISDIEVINILLVGQDRRTNQSRQRSDTIIIMSYNIKTKTVNLISLMRDMYVQIPGYSDNRINAAYQFGGFELLDKTITQNFGVTLDGNIEVDFDGFASIVDLLGGIDINVTDAEANYLNVHEGFDLQPGMNHLNGEEALNYSRIRYVGNADYERTERQRNVLSLIIDKILALSNAEKLKMVDNILSYLTTDLSKAQILIYSANVLNKGIVDVRKYRIPADGTYSSPVIRGMMVLLPDLEKNQTLLKQYILG